MSRDLGINIIGGLISAFVVSAILKWQWNVGWLETAAIAATVFIFVAWLIQAFRRRTQGSKTLVFRQDSDDITVTGNGDVRIATRGGRISGKRKPKS